MDVPRSKKKYLTVLLPENVSYLELCNFHLQMENYGNMTSQRCHSLPPLSSFYPHACAENAVITV